MKLAIHHRPGSFSDRWIAYCKQKNITYKIVNAYDNDIILQVKDCHAMMWHHYHISYKDFLAAKPVLSALEHAGIKVFPDFNTAWHFDDKVAQKYLLEAIDAPLVPSYVFYEKSVALDWVQKTSFPKVFKLRGGAGASNVILVKNKKQAQHLINRSFGRGFSQYRGWSNLKERLRKLKSGKSDFKDVVKGVIRMFYPPKYSQVMGRERGYVYFQEFIPNNDFDIRVIIVGNKAFGLKRMTRKNDFRASGSGDIHYHPQDIDIRCVEKAFEVNDILKSQSIAYDFVFDTNKQPLIIEISYGFSVKAYDSCPGYWDRDLSWHEETFDPQRWMVETVITSIKNIA